jgi:hypothetical protein
MKTLNLLNLRTNALVLVLVLAFCCGCDEIDEDVTTDYAYNNAVSLVDVYYHQVKYDRPTILVFPNLTTATNSVYFHQCVNIKEVQFPKLTSIGEADAVNPYFYFHKNEGLEKVVAPKLTTVYGYLYFWGNSSLELTDGICAITDVYPRGHPGQIDCADPRVDIAGNANNDICCAVNLHRCN